MHNIRLKLAYDGSRYLGWQKTKMGPSIEETLESALLQILQHSVYLQAASRTDAGVHAVGQVVNFLTHKDLLLDKLRHSLNCVLPNDIAIDTVEAALPDFHPTLDCKSKEYHYHVCYGRNQLPTQRHFAWHFPKELDLAAMREAIPLLTGKRDFTAFCNKRINNVYPHYTRYVESIEIHELPHKCLRLEIRGNNFLYKMVRNLVGTLLFIGCSKIRNVNLAEILASEDRRQAGITADAKGLFLMKVNY
ncbi:MAG TPA: tRNA pseudouridine(38-40) synthase TruA [Parachlamydiaceae bacterium]|nr:tRNA pseudouridine(38-40) synthase TruA [Parachlamydiaceae bacterium]